MGMSHQGSKHHLCQPDSTYPASERACVSLLIYPSQGTAAEVTDILDITPTKALERGEIIRHPRTGRTRTQRIAFWSLQSEESVDSLDLRDHLDWILSQVEPCSTALASLQARGDVSMALSAYYRSRTASGGPVVWPRQMKRIAALSLSLEINFSYYGPEEDDEETS